MKAGIITFGSAHNYGALLQAWAFQRHLQNCGLETHIVNYRPSAIDDVYDIYRPPRMKKGDIKPWMRLKRGLCVHLKDTWRLEKRDAFEHFISYQLNTTRPYQTLEDLQDAQLEYDFLFAGSDQIWNTDLTKGFDPAYFLDFGPRHAIRVAYAASLGRENINPLYENEYRTHLENYDYISVREASLTPIVKELTDKPVKVTCDPTLLIERQDFDALKEESAFAQSSYIYAHQIGRERAVVDFADKLSEELDLPVLHNHEQGNFERELDYLYRESPMRILSMIENAQLIISNSFHMTILAIIYHRPFITVPHATRPERMNALAQSLGLERNIIEDVRLMPPYNTLSIDYDAVDRKLVDLRANSRQWLTRIIQTHVS